MIERLNNPFRIGTAILTVGPKLQADIDFTNINPDRINAGTSSWLKPPYMHEYALAKAYFGLVARKGVFDEKYVEGLKDIFEWITTIDRDKFKEGTRIKGRIQPLFFNDEEINTLKRQHLRLQREDFFTNSEMFLGLNFYLTSCAMLMVNTGILRMDNSLPGDLAEA
jgi:hypothetical protein